jgi:hypothetical protein
METDLCFQFIRLQTLPREVIQVKLFSVFVHCISASLIVVDDGLEAVSVSIKVVLVPNRIKVPDSSRWVAQKGVRELVQRADLRLVAETSDLKYEASVRFN